MTGDSCLARAVVPHTAAAVDHADTELIGHDGHIGDTGFLCGEIICLPLLHKPYSSNLPLFIWPSNCLTVWLSLFLKSQTSFLKSILSLSFRAQSRNLPAPIHSLFMAGTSPAATPLKPQYYISNVFKYALNSFPKSSLRNANSTTAFRYPSLLPVSYLLPVKL